MQIIVIVEVKVFLYCPSTKLVEQDHSSIIGVNFSERFRWVGDFYAPFFHYGHCFWEFCFADPSIEIRVDPTEGYPVLVILSEVLQ